LILAGSVATLTGMNLARPSATQPDTVGSRLQAALDEGENITHLVPAIGCVVALTPQRLLVVREGSAFRPKTGVRSWALGEGLTMRAGLVRHETGSLVIKWDRSATSVFIRAEEWERALALVGAVRARVRIEEGLAREARRQPSEDEFD
jgi:hypothetical protein